MRFVVDEDFEIRGENEAAGVCVLKKVVEVWVAATVVESVERGIGEIGRLQVVEGGGGHD